MEKKLPDTMPAPMDPTVSTVPSQTIVPTGRVNAKITRAAQSDSKARPHTSENIRSSRRNRAEVARSRSNTADLAASPLTMNGRRPAVISGRAVNAETRIAIPIVLVTAPSLASITRALPDQKLIAMLTMLTATIRMARALTSRLRTSPTAARAAGTTLLSASESTSPTPAARKM